MNMDFIKKSPDTANIPPEKLDFLMQFASQNFNGDAKQLASQLSNAASSAKQKGLTFNQQETSLLINLLKQNMSPAEQQKADRIISLMQTFGPKNNQK